MPVEMAYGSWPSKISSSMLTQKVRKLVEVRCDPSQPDVVFWVELRPDEGGRGVLCSAAAADHFSAITDWTPSDFSVRSKAHEYGGGAAAVHHGCAYFCNNDDQRIYRQSVAPGSTTASAPQALTPADKKYRFADFVFANGGLYSVLEDHQPVAAGHSKEPFTSLIFIPSAERAEATAHFVTIASGTDFYACPRVSPGQTRLAWIQWSHPNMPFLGHTYLWGCQLDSSNGQAIPGSHRQLLGSVGECLWEPLWLSDASLLYLSDRSGFYCLHQALLPDEQAQAQPEQSRCVLPRDRDVHCTSWVFGCQSYALNAGHSAAVLNYGQELGMVELASGAYSALGQLLPYNDFVYAPLCISEGGWLFCVAAGVDRFHALLALHTRDRATEQVCVVRKGSELSLEAQWVSVPREIVYPSGPGAAKQHQAHAFLWMPQNPDYVGCAGTLPPLVVSVHGGPTGYYPCGLKLSIQYYTSRGVAGFAFAAINYRGSMFLGREYRYLLNLNWGVYDVEDCVSCVEHLVSQGLVAPKQACITGGSAGGFAVLAALTQTNAFQVGSSKYGISDLESLATDTHKFESHYLEQLLGEYPRCAEVYRRRSPIQHVEALSCPVIFFQGTEDKVVAPSQAQSMFDCLKAKRIPTALLLFPGEGHGFQVDANIQLHADAEYAFFCLNLAIPPSVPMPPEVSIENADRMPAVQHKCAL